jgi:hypothetical protein
VRADERARIHVLTPVFISGSLPLIHKPAPVHAEAIEIDQIADWNLLKLEVVDDLSFHDLVELRDGFKLKYNGIINDQVRDIPADVLALITKVAGCTIC